MRLTRLQSLRIWDRQNMCKPGKHDYLEAYDEHPRESGAHIKMSDVTQGALDAILNYRTLRMIYCRKCGDTKYPTPHV